jgi:hypothetical protein
LRKALSQRRKQLHQPIQGEIWLEGLRQRFPTGARLSQLPRLFLTEVDQRLQSRCKQAEIGVLACLLPAAVASGFRRSQGTHQGWIKRLLTAKILLQQIKVASLLKTAFSISPCLARFRHEFGIGRRTLPRVQLARQKGQLLPTPG